MIKLAIVDDEPQYAETLQNFIAQYGNEYKEEFEIDVYTDGDQIVEHYKSDYDIILMDVEMKFLDGMSAAEEIRKIDSEVVIIFVTNMPQYAVRGYEVEAMDYVLKPISYIAFSHTLNRAIERIKNRKVKTLSITVRGNVSRIPIDQLYYIESQGHTLLFHTAKGIKEAAGTMKEVESELVPHHFFRGNKGYLINLAHVNHVLDGCAIVEGEELLLSRGRKKEFMEALADYWGGAMD